MYDSTCKFIAAEFPEDMAIWLLGKPLPLTELKPTELSLEPIRADSLIFLESEDLVLHIEFQTDPDEDLPFRMLDYRLRVYRRYPHKLMKQFVIYLRESTSPLVRQEEFTLSETHHQFSVIRLWEMPPETLLQSKGLWPFAVLAASENRENLLREISEKIDKIEERREKSNLAASTAIIAGLVLNKSIIQRLLREEIMKESVIYQEIREEGRAEGRAEGRRQEGINLILRQLNRIIGEISPNLSQKIRDLSVEDLENLGEALLDFKTEEDLRQWLRD